MFIIALIESMDKVHFIKFELFLILSLHFCLKTRGFIMSLKDFVI